MHKDVDLLLKWECREGIGHKEKQSRLDSRAGQWVRVRLDSIQVDLIFSPVALAQVLEIPVRYTGLVSVHEFGLSQK